MPGEAGDKNAVPPSEKMNSPPEGLVVPFMTVCVDASPVSAKVIQHANTIAGVFGCAISLVHVIEPEKLPNAPSDPVEWDMRRREAETYISGLANGFKLKAGTVKTRILEGHSADQISGILPVAEESITALCRCNDTQRLQIGETTRRVIENSTGSVLVIPASVPTVEQVKYSRVLVPLDGSPRAESAVPYAVKIACTHNAELILAHVTSPPELMHTGPPVVEHVELSERLMLHNESAAQEYLDRIRNQLHDCGTKIRTLVLKGGDARRLLAHMIEEQMADLVVLSAHGKSGFADVPSGNVASFIVARSSAPVLMIRQAQQSGTEHIFSRTESDGIRLPVGHTR